MLAALKNIGQQRYTEREAKEEENRKNKLE